MMNPDKTGTYFGGTPYATTSAQQAAAYKNIALRGLNMRLNPEVRALDRKEAMEKGEVRMQKLEEAASRMKLQQVQQSESDKERRKRRKRMLMQAMNGRGLQPSEKLELAELQDVSVS